MSLKVLILGVNGFIGNSLTQTILETKDWEVYGMDMNNNKLLSANIRPRIQQVIYEAIFDYCATGN